jgi:alkaline phosphatase D
MTAFYEELVDSFAVGEVAACKARFWIRVQQAGSYRVRVCAIEGPRARPSGLVRLRGRDDPCDGTVSLLYPDDLPDAAPLHASTRYLAQLERADGAPIGQSRFETAPNDDAGAPDCFALAVMSCHQPFAGDGNLHAGATRLLDRAADIFASHHVKRVLLLGDQMYADQPEELSLFGEHFARVAPAGRQSIFDCSEAEVRRLYQQRYRHYFNSPGFRRIQAQFPCYAILDDHEIVDNFGSDPAHHSAHWRNLRRGALAAAFDYQGLRTHARGGAHAAMDFGFRYGPLACYVLDLRSERTTRADSLQIYGPAQLTRLEDFLQQHRDAAVCALGLSVPLVHLPDWATALGVQLCGEGTDIAERWANPKASADRLRLLQTLARHQRSCPHQQLILLGGDVHVGMINAVQWPALDLSAHQLVSSAVSHSNDGFAGFLATQASKLSAVRQLCGNEPSDARCEVALVGGERPGSSNPYSGLNLGIVRVMRNEAGLSTTLSLVGVSDAGEPQTMAETTLSTTA